MIVGVEVGWHRSAIGESVLVLWQTGKRWAWVLSAKHEHGERVGQRLATTVDEGVAWFARYFGYAAQSDFLNGASGRFTGCEIGWLMNATNFEKVLSGKYHGEQREAAHA